MTIPLAEITQILTNYNFGKLLQASSLSKGYANTNYKITTTTGDYLYRIFRQQSGSEIDYEMTVLSILKKHNFPAAFPYARKDGTYITETTEGTVAIYQFIEGHEPEANAETVTAIGKAVAQLNSIKDPYFFKRTNFINSQSCQHLITLFDTAPFQYPNIFSFFKKETEQILPYLNIPLPKGLIHSDVFTDNTIFKKNKLQAIIDFEPVCYGNLLFEVCMTVHGFCYQNNDLNTELMHTFLKAYQSVRPLTAQEMELFPYYLRWTAHGMASWHLEHSLIFTGSEKQLTRVKELQARVRDLKNRAFFLT